MHRIAGYGKFEMPLKSGFFWFTNGDLGASTPVPRTVIQDDYLNALQEEIAACIEYQGTALNAATEISTTMVQLNNAIGQSWVTFTVGTAGAASLLDSRNLATIGAIVHNGTGDFTIKWENAYADSNYLCLVSVADAANSIWATIDVVDADEVRVRVFNSGGPYETSGDTLRINVKCSGTAA